MQNPTELILAPSDLAVIGALPAINSPFDIPQASDMKEIISRLPIASEFDDGADWLEEDRLSVRARFCSILLGYNGNSTSGVWGRLYQNVSKMLEPRGYKAVFEGCDSSETPKEALMQAAHAQSILTSLLGIVPQEEGDSPVVFELSGAWNKMAGALPQTLGGDVSQTRLDVALRELMHDWAPISMDAVNSQRQEREKSALIC